jgi:hypothetical protein
VNREHVFRKKRLLQRRVDLFFFGVGDEGIFKLERIPAVGNNGDLDIADLVAIEAWRLLVCERCGRLGLQLMRDVVSVSY